MGTTVTIKIGYLCDRGHFCFDADPEENGACGSKSVGDILVKFSPDDFVDGEDALGEAQAHLAEIIEAWRNA